MKKKIVIGTRTSELALWQTNHVKSEIEKHNPGITVELKLIKTKGDKILDVALSKIGDKGLFTKELENALLNGEVDLAVHSLKDLETEMPEGLMLGAVSKRHPVEDVLIAKVKNMTIQKLPKGAKVGTGSLRRRCQILKARPDLQIEELRGNVPTRIKKLHESDWDAIILARAGVERLGLTENISSYIPVDKVLPAVGQGALGLQIRTDDTGTLEIIKSLHDEETFIAVTAERRMLRVLEGGCQVPIGALAQVRKNGLYLDGFVGSLDGKTYYRKKMRGSLKKPAELGEKMAKELIAMGADKILQEIKSN
ncbi:MAG: hydroxymethylbilane synthase [Ignavibacteriaceae bacterium]|nr:hydroxymethylbilane synthase [Ignavibacteriaceae bacterium]